MKRHEKAVPVTKPLISLAEMKQTLGLGSSKEGWQSFESAQEKPRPPREKVNAGQVHDRKHPLDFAAKARCRLESEAHSDLYLPR